MTYDVLIIGAGLAGLCCARTLQQHRTRFKILEASDGVGGRIRTDLIEGFRLDRGFQVFLSSYPEAKQVLNFEALQLKPYLRGALVRYGERFHQLVAPWRRLFAALGYLFSPIGSLADKWRVARHRSRSLKGTIEERFQDGETTTVQALQENGLLADMIDRFFRPFLSGIFSPLGAARPVRWQPGIYVCGDHRDNASIQGAMVSGRRAAEAILEDHS